MRLSEEEINKVIDAVRVQPRTVQEISKILQRSWVTTDKYLGIIKAQTGLINIKTFRAGTQAALKIVYYENKEIYSGDEVKSNLLESIRNSRIKADFDFMDVYQFVNETDKKSSFMYYTDKNPLIDPRLISLLKQANNHVFIFSGNLSFLHVKHLGINVIDVFEDLLERKVFIKILMRINVASISNIKEIEHLLIKYPKLIEIRHRYHPLRGFLVDGVGRFKNEEHIANYKVGELDRNARIFYEVYGDWNAWLEKVFWNMFNSSINYQNRVKEIKKVIST